MRHSKLLQGWGEWTPDKIFSLKKRKEDNPLLQGYGFFPLERVTGELTRKLNRCPDNPIISPNPAHPWENRLTYNPAAFELQGNVYLLYRAQGEDWVSRLGLAKLPDGFTVAQRLPYPVFEHPIGAEDPRVTVLDKIYMLFVIPAPSATAAWHYPRVGFTWITKEDFLAQRWNWANPKIISPPETANKAYVLFPEKIEGHYCILHSLTPRVQVHWRETMEFEEGEYIASTYYQTQAGDYTLGSIGSPPIKTPEGWLVFFHMHPRDHRVYCPGAMLLDLKNPEKVIARTPYPVLIPEKWYEKFGFVRNVIYTCGAVLRGDTLLLYYGASDNYVGVAWANLHQFLKQAFG